MLTDSTKIIAVGLVIALNFILALFVYRNNPKSTTNMIFGALGGLISAWLMILYASQSPALASSALFWARMAIFIAMPMSYTFFLLAHTIPHPELQMSKKAFVIGCLVTGIIMGVNVSPYAFTGLSTAAEGALPSPTAGPGMMPFGLASTFFSVAAVYTLIRKYFRASGIEKRQISLVMTGILLMLGLIILTIFIPVVFLKNASFVLLGPLYTFIFLALTSYAIVKHRFLDIRFILIRAISFLLFIMVCAGIYGLAIFIIIEKIGGQKINLIPAISSLFFIIATSLSFQPILVRIRKLTNSIFFKNDYDSDVLLSELTHIMAQSIELEHMSNAILCLLMSKMNLSKAAFLIFKENKVSDVISQGYDGKKNTLRDVEKITTRDLATETSFIFENLPEGALKKTFRTLGVEVAIPIKVGKEKVAILILGAKLSGDAYSEKDVNLLNIFAPEAGIAIQNAKSYAEIKKFSKVLEKRVDERTRELKETQKRELAKAQDIAKLKDEFVFVAAHELRTPVTAIRGFLQMVTPATKALPKDVQENISYIGSASEHLNQLVNDLLEVSRSESDTLKVAVKPIHLTPLIKGLIMEVSQLAKQRKITIRTDITPRVDTALVDEGKMKEVVLNLLSNAIKYNKDGGQIDVRLLQEKKTLVFSVQDTGYGIPKDQQEKIFQKFFRASTKRTEEVLGTGLGLFITRMLVEKMGGVIGFSSVENKGSTFSVTVPSA